MTNTRWFEINHKDCQCRFTIDSHTFTKRKEGKAHQIVCPNCGKELLKNDLPNKDKNPRNTQTEFQEFLERYEKLNEILDKSTIKEILLEEND